MPIDARKALRAETLALLTIIDRVADAPVIFGRHPGYRKALEHLSYSNDLTDHLEAAQYFVVAYKHLFPGFGLRQELMNARSAKALGCDWCYEPFDEEGAPVGVEILNDGLECVFTGVSPLAAIVRMLRLMIPERDELLNPTPIRQADVVEPAALPEPPAGLPEPSDV